MKNAIVYCRVSSKEQVDGTSLESQEQGCRDYAARNDLNVVRVFIEKGESAKFADRTQLLELIEFCGHRQNEVRALLVWRVDRLARNVGDHFNIKASLMKTGVQVLSVSEPIDANPEGKLLETILAGFAQFDNDLRAARTIQGMRKKLQEGIFPWKAPLGYKTSTPPGQKQKKTQPNVPDEPTFSLLRRAWHEFATGAYTKAEILRAMTIWGIRTAAGKPIPNQTLDNIFGDPFYAGILRDPWSETEYSGRHLPLVSQEIFDKVQVIIARRNRSIRHVKLRPEFPLRGFARCRSCRFNLTGSFSRGRSERYPYYHCERRICGRRTYSPAEKLHQEFSSFLSSTAFDRKYWERLKSFLSEALQARMAGEKIVQERRRVASERFRQQEAQLIRMRMDGLIDDRQFMAEKSLLAGKLRDLQSIKMNAKANVEESVQIIDEICEPMADLSKAWNQIIPIDLKLRFQRSILPTGFVAEEIGTAPLSGLFSFLRAFATTNPTLVPPTGEFWNQTLKELRLFGQLIRELR